VFQAEKPKHVLPRLSVLAVPGIGFHNDIYIMNIDEKKVYKLTDLKTKKKVLDPNPTTGLLQPHFSNDGTLLSWSERIDKGGKWGRWVIRIADFRIEDGIPKIDSIRTLTPGVNQLYYESNDFTPDDEQLIICGNLEEDQTAFGCDIYTIELNSKGLQRLTFTLEEFDECPHPSPDGKRIAYLSTRGFEFKKTTAAWWRWAKGEFWLMDADGKNKQRLTYFNEPGNPEYTGKRVIPANISWNRDGFRLLVSIVVEKRKGILKDQLWYVELRE
jgi:dipeptidyl aminopeptidase/acylaminoacyl peptidase